MKRKNRHLLAAVILCLFLLAGCTEQQKTEKMQGLVSSNSVSLPPTDETINGIRIYQMGQFMPDDRPRYSFQVLSAETFPTLAAAGLKVADLYSGSIYMSLSGEPQKIELDGENLPQGFAVLFLQMEVDTIGDVPQEDIDPDVNNLTLTTKGSLEGTEQRTFEPVYNSKASEKNREQEYFHLPHLEKGESESFQTAFLVPKDLLTDGNLYITIYETNGATTRAIALTLDKGGEAS